MKKLSLFAAALAVLSLSSCKKGENDPFISLKSRDARLVGEWKLSSSSSTSEDIETYSDQTGTETDSEKSTEEVSGGVKTKTDVDNDQVSTTDGTVKTSTSVSKYNVSQSLTIEKDGTFKLMMSETQTSYTDFNNDLVTIDAAKQTTSEMEYNGQWYWVTGKKSKEAIQFVVNGQVAFTWEIDQLKNKELVVKSFEYQSSKDSGLDADGKSWSSEEKSTKESTSTYTQD